MKLYIDPNSTARFYLISAALIRDHRRYYITHQADNINALIVCRNGLTLEDLHRSVVDAVIGNDTAWQGLAHENDVGKLRTKVTIFRALRGERRGDTSLAAVMRDAIQKAKK